MRKRGQITLFIIFGLIIVFAAIFFIYVSSVSLFFQPSKVIPANVEPIKNLIEQCLEDSAQPLINHMITHSGYTDLSTVGNNYFPELRVPYSLPRNREEMEIDLRDKIQSELETCIDFTQFEQFNIVEKRSLKLTVNIYDEDVTFSIEYPLEIINKQNNEIIRLLDFKKIIQTKLGKLSDLARNIMNKENTGITLTDPVTDESRTIHFLEEMTLDVLRSGSNVIFPYEGMEFTTDRRKWSIENDLKPELTNGLWANLGCITYQGTASEELPISCLDPTGTEDYSSYYQKFFIPLPQILDYKNTKVTITPKYKDEVIDFTEFSVSPSSGDNVEPILLFESRNPITNIIASPFKLYHHRYHIEYPVLFSLSEGDTFNFATEIIIKDNQADREDEFYFSTSPAFSLDIFCKDEEDTTEYTVQAVDKLTGLAIRDVEIEYQCVQYVCDIGKTSPDLIPNTNIERYGSFPKLTANFPFCYNGVLIANKENYIESTKVISEDFQARDTIKIEMTPLAKLDYELVIMDGLARRTTLDDNETILIMLSNTDQNYEEQIYYSPELEKEQIEFLVGNYKYNIIAHLTKDEAVIGGFIGEPEIKISRGDKTIVFSFIADSQLVNADEDTIANFLATLEEKSKEEIYQPIIKW